MTPALISSAEPQAAYSGVQNFRPDGRMSETPPLRSMRVKESGFLVTRSQMNIFIVTLSCQLSLSVGTLLVRQRSCYWCVLQSQSSCISIYSRNQQSMCKSHHSPHVNRSQRYTLWVLVKSHWCVSATGRPAPQILIPALGK